MKRSQAGELIDRIREVAANTNLDPASSMVNIRALLLRAGLIPLQPCGGEAHSNPFIDNCPRCAPRWEFVGAKEPVT